MAWIAVDFDGTLVANGYPAIGVPIAPMIERVKRWLDQGWEVRIFTNRADREADCVPVRAFFLEHFGRELPITATKDRECVAIYDDIAIGVVRDTGELVQ